jgi:hypothetical protein
MFLRKGGSPLWTTFAVAHPYGVLLPRLSSALSIAGFSEIDPDRWREEIMRFHTGRVPAARRDRRIEKEAAPPGSTTPRRSYPGKLPALCDPAISRLRATCPGVIPSTRLNRCVK